MEMKSYIGTKLVFGTPMTKGEYNSYRNGFPSPGEFETEEGYLVEYRDGGKPNDLRHKGYISWSPKEVFESAYRVTNRLTFGYALEAMRAGLAVARATWEEGKYLVLLNDKNTFAVLRAGKGGSNWWTSMATDILKEDWVVLDTAR